MRVWKRCIAALLALIMMFTSANFGFAAGRLDEETNLWSATAAAIVAERYGVLSNAKVAAVLGNGAINSGAEYSVAAPYHNGTEGKSDLIAVDYRGKVFYVDSYMTEGYLWVPVEAELLADGEVQETFALTESVTYYNNVEYYAEQAFTYDGNHYTIEVTYELALNIDAAEQQRILEIPMHLGQAVRNIEKTLSGMWYDLYTFEQMIPSLNELQNKTLPAAKDGEAGEPFFKADEHAAELAAITALYAEYTKDAAALHLDMFDICDESLITADSGLVYAIEHGDTVRDTAAALYEKLLVLAESQRLNSLLSQLKGVDSELHAKLKNLYRYLDRFVGTASKEGSLEILKNNDNWSILDESVQARVFKEDYDTAEFAALETAVSGMRNVAYTVPAVSEEPITATKVSISCEIVTCDVTVTVTAQVCDPETGELKSLAAYSDTVTLLQGTVPEDVVDAVEELGLEDTALARWNSVSEDYQIGLGHYDRAVTTLEESLQSDLTYEISYTPKTYEVKTNFAGKLQVPFGYRLTLPEYDGEDGWYDYHVTYADGKKDSHNQGMTFVVNADATIEQTKGAAKFAYRILDFLAEDSRYEVSDAAAKILKNAAVKSPELKIRIPDTKVFGEIVNTGSGFYVEAADCPSGISGMTWKLDAVTLYDGINKVQDVAVSGGKASWETAGFTHVIAHYSLHITKLSFTQKLTDEELTEYINLPHVLTQEIVQQNEALSGDTGITGKTMLAAMKEREGIMTLLPSFGEFMTSAEGKNAILRLSGSENANVKGANGEKLGYGGWSATSDEPAIYKYLKLCDDADWSVATYYQEGYYEKLAEQSLLMADCLEDILKDPGFIEVLELFNVADKKKEIEDIVPELRELSTAMKGPNSHLNLKHTQIHDLVAACLEAEGKTRAYEAADSLYATTTLRRNGENSGSLQVTVQVGNVEKTLTMGYELETVVGSDRFHAMTAAEAETLHKFIDDAKASGNIDDYTEQFYDLAAVGTVFGEGDALYHNEVISLIYTPKTYVVTIKGVSTDKYMETIHYNGGESYVIDLPAKSDDPAEKSYYQYIFPNKGGDDAVRNVANGTAGHYGFSEKDLLTLFTGGSYSVIRKELRIKGDPEVSFKPKLSAELIRGAQVDRKNHYFYLDAVPTGLTCGQLLEQLNPVVENGGVKAITLTTPYGYVLEEDDLVVTGTKLHYVLQDVFGKEYDSNLNEFVIIMMGDVNGDGLCDDSDLDKIIGIYFLETDKKGNYVEPFPLTTIESLAANMNNSKKIDSNDAWIIRSKSLYWNADKKQHQIIYRSVL